MSAAAFESPFDQIHDIIVYGNSYAAYAAALNLNRSDKDVLLVGPRGDVVEESGRLFATATGDSESPEWIAFRSALEQHDALGEGIMEGALAEILAVDSILAEELPTLFYVLPVAVETTASGLHSVIVATKTGCRRLTARKWIDASESGLLAQLCAGAPLPAKTPAAREFNLYYHSANWPADLDDAPLKAAAPDASLLPTGRPDVRCLRLSVQPGQDGWGQVKAAARAAHATFPEAFDGAIMSHCSLAPYDQYAAGELTLPTLPANLALAVPALADGAVATLAERFDLGLAAAHACRETAAVEIPDGALTAPLPDVSPVAERSADVFVAGAGTGGAVAAIAAGRGADSVICVDPLAFPGGIGAGGGIHWYYFGVSGGLQEELDQRILDDMGLFASKKQVRGFHPDMKKLTLLEMFAEAGVDFIPGAMVYGVERDGRRITAAWVASEHGPIRVSATNWIDSTGDADLCALAGAATWMGREGDGQVHAYSQSIGQIRQQENGLMMAVTNFDAGWTDPTSPEDLTRARLEGIRQYIIDSYDALRPTYIAPAIGLRQSRHVRTDYELDLNDLIVGSSFPDAVGYTGAHYDNHAIDYHFESDEAMFWVWGCEQWRTRTRCEIPYRMLIPRDLENVWIACRAAGVTPDAHHSFRMQRDMQRLGEIAGRAAALTAPSASDARGVDQQALRSGLAESGALEIENADIDHDFGPIMSTNLYQDALDAEDRDSAIAALREGKPGPGMWQLYRHRDQVEADVVALLDSSDPHVSWFAAVVVASWGDARAEARLIQALESQENGHEGKTGYFQPKTFPRVIARWGVAIGLLRICGTRAGLQAILKLGQQPGLAMKTRALIATTLLRLVERGVATSADISASLLDQLGQRDYDDHVAMPQSRMPLEPTEMVKAEETSNPPTKAQIDYDWQLQLVLGRLRKALGLPLHAGAESLATDPRAMVRRAAATLSA